MTGCFDAIVPITRVAVDRTDLDAALHARVADDLGGGVETHRLRIEEHGGEYRPLMAVEPGREIDQQTGREHDRTQVTNAHPVCRLLLDKKKKQQTHEF